MGKPGMKPPTISRSRTFNFRSPTAFTRKLPGQPSSSGRTDTDYLVELHQYAQDRVRRELLTNTNKLTGVWKERRFVPGRSRG